MNILLTGSSGFLGSRALYHLEQQGHLVTSIPSAMLRGTLSGERLASLEPYFGQNRADILLHTAAISDTGYAEQHPDESFQANVELLVTLARLAHVHGTKLISCSSDQVYNGSRTSRPNPEAQTLAPANVYGRHKLEAEARIQELCPDAVHLRLTWMYDLPLYHQKTNNNLVLGLLKTAITGQAARYSTSDYRGITYVRSVAERLPLTFDLPGGAYNFGSENDLNLYDTAVDFLRAMGLASRAPELVLPDSGREERNLRLDCAKIRQQGIEFPSTAEGIRQLVADYPGLL